MTFSGRTVIVTGGTGALGSVVIRRFVALDANIAVPLHTQAGSESLARQLGLDDARLLSEKADLTNSTEVQSFVQSVFRRFGRIDVLINCAGGYLGGKVIEEHGVDDLRRMLDLNTLTVFTMCRAVLPLMKKQGHGRIVNITSLGALHAPAGSGAYAVSKVAVATLTETIAAEVKGTGVTANAVAPGTILTEANKRAMPGADFLKWVNPDHIAEAILFLSSEESSRVNGTIVRLP